MRADMWTSASGNELAEKVVNDLSHVRRAFAGFWILSMEGVGDSPETAEIKELLSELARRLTADIGTLVMDIINSIVDEKIEVGSEFGLAFTMRLGEYMSQQLVNDITEMNYPGIGGGQE